MNFFNMNPNLKYIYIFFGGDVGGMLGGWRGGARISEFFYTKNPNLKRKNMGGGLVGEAEKSDFFFWGGGGGRGLGR